ncbi:MAG: TM1266 family iron-only hydrogenase system putative regulator [Emergencia sp.]
METRVALIAIIIKDAAAAEILNEILHAYSGYIIGRMGLPYKEKNMHIISVAVDAPPDVINALSGRIGRLQGVSSKVAYAGE